MLLTVLLTKLTLSILCLSLLLSRLRGQVWSHHISQNVLRTQPLSIPGISHTTIIYFSECLEELGLLIKTFGMNVCQPSPGKALSMMASQICDRDNGVRSSALNAIVEAYILVGETVYTHCGRVRARLFIVVVVVSVLLLFLFLSWVDFWLLLKVWLLVSVALALILFERVEKWYGRLTVWAVKVWLFKNGGVKDFCILRYWLPGNRFTRNRSLLSQL